MEDELVGILGKLVEFVENASPAIWEVAQRQVVADIVSSTIWAMVFLVAIVGSSIVTKRMYTILNELRIYNKGKNWADKRDPDSYVPPTAVTAGTVAVSGTIVFLILVTDIVKMAINPAYYAIENILSMVR